MKGFPRTDAIQTPYVAAGFNNATILLAAESETSHVLGYLHASFSGTPDGLGQLLIESGDGVIFQVVFDSAGPHNISLPANFTAGSGQLLRIKLLDDAGFTTKRLSAGIR